MRTEQWLPADDATGEGFCPECGQPGIWEAVATAVDEKRRGWTILPGILVALGLYLVVSLVPAVRMDYQFSVDEEMAMRTGNELTARDALGIAGAYLTRDLQELALAVFISAVGLSAITRRKLEAKVNRPGSGEVSTLPGRKSGKRWRTILRAWTLAETLGMSFFHVLLVIAGLVIVGLLRHGAVPSLALLDQTWRVTFEIVCQAFDALFLGHR